MTPAPPTHPRLSGRLLAHRVFLSAFVLCAVAWLIVFWRDPPFDDGRWLAGLLLLAAASTIAGLTRYLPIENALMAAVFVIGISSIIQTIGLKTGIPFGSYTYAEDLGPELYDTLPWAIPFLWVVIILTSRDVARSILRPWHKLPNLGWFTIGLTCLLAVITDLSLEPFAAMINHFWIWQTAPSVPAWYTAPWVNFLGWAISAFLILVFTTPWLINKNPQKNSPPDSHPLVLWLAVNLLLAAANALHHLWWAAGFGLAASLGVAFLALRGARWQLKN
ncbi:MAG: hypothetical protein JWR19_1722 [Pedosphaera sp.]|nr:hypothetical protein [Pedosphaera sp.]